MGKTKILGQAQATAEQMAAYLLSVNPAPKISVEPLVLCQMYITQAAREGVRGDALFAQSCKETGNFVFGGSVKPEQNNFAGLGAVDSSTAGAFFDSPELGILAQAQHAKAYAVASGLSCLCVDPRYSLLERYGKLGTAPHWEELGGKWAVPGYDTSKYVSLAAADAAEDSYGYQIIKILEKILTMTKSEKKEEVKKVKRTKRYQTKNPAYTCGRKITVKGCMLHSYGCPQPDPNVLAKNWDKADAPACVHEHIGKDEAINTLPCMEQQGIAARAWHAGTGTSGSSANNTHLSAEMTEPSTIKYTGGSNWIELGDGSNTKAHVLATYKNAVEIFAEWCAYHKLDPLADGVIISHSEGYRRGVACNHGDVEHIWKRFGLTMAQFRQDVKAAMEGTSVDFGGTVEVTDISGQQINPLDGTVTVIYAGADGLSLRKRPAYTAAVEEVTGAGAVYTVVGISADEQWYKLSTGLFVSAIPSYVSFKATPAQKETTAGTGYYRVRKAWTDAASQIGAFKSKDNAVELCCQNSGYRVYDPEGKEIYPCTDSQAVPFTVRVKISDLQIRKGPGTTYDYHKQGGKPIYTGKGIFTIVKTADGPGAKLWGLLKSYAGKENGWIALDEAYVEIR